MSHTLSSLTSFSTKVSRLQQLIAPGGETICPPPMAVSRGGATSVADGSAVHTSLVAGQLQAASVRRA